MSAETRVCPNCGSTNIGHDPISVLSRLALDEAQQCEDCGYTGIFPVVAADDVDSFQETVSEQPEPLRIEPGFNRGRFFLGVILLALGIPASTIATWGDGLLPALLAIAVGAAVVFEQLSRRTP